MKNLILLFLALITMTSNAQSKQAEVNQKHRVVFQMNSNDQQSQKVLINNIQNIKKTWGANVAIEVVAFGSGVEFLMTQKSVVVEGHCQND